MWYLADKLNLSTSDISQLSGIGILDLEATKEKNNFIYLPKRKVILTTTKQLEKISKG
ncbi:hypothetical protein FM121_04300 [Vagococcus fluvialis bH819]|uniref:Uncharacterized protein n=2 Tax=Enterococcaceae TaxID=81852 RepID=A0A1X6WLU2_9ENTE|nr:hypothetical protein FM121_04300 [Vagococcus fluvialis bH819]